MYSCNSFSFFLSVVANKILQLFTISHINSPSFSLILLDIPSSTSILSSSSTFSGLPFPFFSLPCPVLHCFCYRSHYVVPSSCFLSLSLPFVFSLFHHSLSVLFLFRAPFLVPLPFSSSFQRSSPSQLYHLPQVL